MFSGFSERLKQAAQAGVESFDSAGQALQKSVTQAHLPDGTLALPKLPTIPGLGISTDSNTLRDKAPVPAKVPQVGSPTGDRRSIDGGTRNSALANRLSSLVSGSGSGSPSPRHQQNNKSISRPSSPSSKPSSSTTPSTPSKQPSDPASIPLPDSPPSSPLVKPTTKELGDIPAPAVQGTFLISDSNPSSSVGTPNDLRTQSPAFGSSGFFGSARLASSGLREAVEGNEETGKVEDAVGAPGDIPPPAGPSEVEKKRFPEEVQEDGFKSDPQPSPPLPPQQAALESLPSTIPTDPSELTSEFSSLAERVAKVNAILAKASPMLQGGIEDADALSGWLQMVNGKMEMGADEMKRLTSKLELQESRIGEIRDTHKLESNSSNKLISELRDQVSTQEKNLSTQANQVIQIASLRGDLTKAQTQAKDAEEKATKAINLLKTVRSKLVKVERERDDAEKTQAEERNERSRMVENVEKLRGEREKEVLNLRQGFEKEVAGLKEKYERDLAIKKGQWELEMITTKATHAKDLATKSTRITSLTNTITTLTTEKQAQFALLQQRQEEVEAARSFSESTESRMKEMEFQLREALDRASAAEDTVADLKKELSSGAAGPSLTSPLPDSTDIPSAQPQDIPRLLADANAQSEAKVADYRARLSRLERERLESEEEHARQLKDRVAETDRLKGNLVEKDRAYAEMMGQYDALAARLDASEEDKKTLRGEMARLESALKEMKEQQVTRGEVEAGFREEMDGVREQLGLVTGELEEARNAASQLRGTNRTLREEMRRIQSSAQLLERQRGPGVGYWSAIGSNPPLTASTSGTHSPAETPNPRASMERTRRGSGVLSPVKMNGGGGRASPVPSEVGSKKEDEEEVNLEYLRNVILQFLEHKEMRANLVQVLGVILRFTPPELRRLKAKLNS